MSEIVVNLILGGFMEKTLHNSDISGTKQNVPDVQTVGNGDAFQLLCKASSEKEGWMKSTKAMNVGHGCLVQVTTQQRNDDVKNLLLIARELRKRGVV